MMPSPETLDLARRILAYETVEGKRSESTEFAAVLVNEKLRPRLFALAGVAGYQALLSRALTLARAEAPSLSRMLKNYSRFRSEAAKKKVCVETTSSS